MTSLTALADRTVAEAKTPAYNSAIGYLRAFLVALVVAHHAMLAYHPFAAPPARSLVAQPRLWEAFPVVDSQRWSGFSLFVGFNDVFFMSLLFLLSGLFVWRSLERKGSREFFKGRLLRLGLPFIVAACILAPLAYYPAYLQTAQHGGLAGYWREWLSLGQWPAGPAWFVWVLLAFDCVAALLFLMKRSWGNTLGEIMSARPGRFFVLLIAISAATYIPMALIFTSFQWSAFGPFTFQTSRIFHYLAYFLIGVGVGAMGIDRGLLAAGGKLARRWPFWTIAALLLFAIATVITIATFTAHPTSLGWAFATDLGFVLSCAATCFAMLAVFVRFAQTRSRVLDSLAGNSYAIYLVHYAVVSWTQYALLSMRAPGLVKGAVAFIVALGISWGVAAAIRRIPAVAHVV